MYINIMSSDSILLISDNDIEDLNLRFRLYDFYEIHVENCASLKTINFHDSLSSSIIIGDNLPNLETVNVSNIYKIILNSNYLPNIDLNISRIYKIIIR